MNSRIESTIVALDVTFNDLTDDDIAMAIIYLLEGRSIKVLETVQGSLDDFKEVQAYHEYLAECQAEEAAHDSDDISDEEYRNQMAQHGAL